MRVASTIFALVPFLVSLTSVSVSALPADQVPAVTAAPNSQWPVNPQGDCDIEKVKQAYSSFSAKLGGFSTSVVEGYNTAGAPKPTDACASEPLMMRRGPHHEGAVTFTLPGTF